MGGIGPWQVVLILAVVVLVFGAKRLPELARGTGQALRIFKTEVKGLTDDDDVKPEAIEHSEADKKPEQG